MIGYGRREMDVTPQELDDYIVSQLGALQAFAAQAGQSVGHVKPHGVIVRLLADEEYAHAVMDGIHAVDEDLIFIAPDVTLYEHAKNHPIPAVMDGYVDMLYRPDRTLIIEQKKTEHDPADVADRFVSIATEGTVEAVNGDMIDIPAKSICIHGDNPNVVELLDEIYSRLDDHGIELAGLDAVV